MTLSRIISLSYHLDQSVSNLGVLGVIFIFILNFNSKSEKRGLCATKRALGLNGLS